MKQGDFTEVAKHYHNRPAYSVMLLDKLIKCVNDTNKPLDKLRVVEVGAGTGKLTKILADDFGMNIRAVEPNDSMREEGKSYTKDSNISWYKGSGEDTGIESNSADWVIMASSFHWTDPKKSLPEFARILDDNYYYNAAYANNADNGGGGGRGGGGGGGGQTLSKFLYTKQGSLFYSNMESTSYSRRLDIP